MPPHPLQEIVEEAMNLLSIYAPSVYAEMKGWEFVTRLQKIRAGILNTQQQILNYAETGQVIPDSSENLALTLNNLGIR